MIDLEVWSVTTQSRKVCFKELSIIGLLIIRFAPRCHATMLKVAKISFLSIDIGRVWLGKLTERFFFCFLGSFSKNV